MSVSEKCRFTKVPNQMSYFGKIFVEANSLYKCKAACVEKPKCKAIDYNGINRGCFLHFGKYREISRHSDHIDQYIKLCDY